MQKPNYRFSPSLLNSYSDFLNAEKLYDQFYGFAEDPSVTLEEFEKKLEQELLDSVNRVDKGPIEAADRGTCANEAIDCILEHRAPKDGVFLQTVRDPDGEPQSILAKMNGFTFNFDAGLIMQLAVYFRGSTCQHRCEATINTAYGPVILYGDADYIRRDVVYDLKTTGKYSYGKFSDGWQKDLYPWCLIESGELNEVSGFEYTVALLKETKKDPLISGDIFREWYDYDHASAGVRLRSIAESFISWIELHRSEIHHDRIFNK